MTVEAPSRPPETSRPVEPSGPSVERADLEALVEALIEEARQRARRRRRRNAAIVALAALVAVGCAWAIDRLTGSSSAAPSAAPPAAGVPALPAATLALSGHDRVGSPLHLVYWTRQGVRDAGIPGRAFGWSPDGSRLLVQRGQALYSVSADGASSVLLGHGDGYNAVWSPDGTQVAFLGGAVPGHKLWRQILVVGADGRRVRILRGGWASDGVFFSGNLTWAPGGTQLVYAGRSAGENAFGLYRVRADGSATPRRLEIRPSVKEPVQPTFSPDGTRIAFTAAGGLFVANADGTDARLVARDGHGAVWSPDGTMLAFRTRGRNSTVHGDGTHLARLPDGSWGGLGWSPDSRHVAYAGGEGHIANGDVFLVRSDGTGPVRILHRPGGAYFTPIWRAGTATTETG